MSADPRCILCRCASETRLTDFWRRILCDDAHVHGHAIYMQYKYGHGLNYVYSAHLADPTIGFGMRVNICMRICHI